MRIARRKRHAIPIAGSKTVFLPLVEPALESMTSTTPRVRDGWSESASTETLGGTRLRESHRE
jgi:hypothetical protein